MNRTSLRAYGLAFALLVGGTSAGSAQGLPTVPPARAAELRAKADAATSPYAAIIEEHATVYAVDPALVVSIIMVESKGDPNAYSSSGAMGLMQLMTATCEDYGIADPYDPNENIRGGVALLANHLNRYRGDLKRVLAAYNAGARRADDGSWKKIRETTKYVPAVLAYYAALRPGGDGYAPSDRPAVPSVPVATPPAPPIRARDMMFAVVQAASAEIEPYGIAENGALHETANALLNDVLTGKLVPGKVQAKAKKLLTDPRPKTLHAVCLTTPDAEGFTLAWAQQPRVPGRFVGLAHGTGGNGHVWVVILAGY